MSPYFLHGLVALFVLGSIVWDLTRGETRVRGLGRFARAEQPSSYWLLIGIKAFVMAGLVVIALMRATS